MKHRVHIYVGSLDTYYLNLGVEKFAENVNGKGGEGWANITILEGEPHGGVYQLRDIFNYLELLEGWVKDHAPDGKTPLAPERTETKSRGNRWEDVMAFGGRAAAVDRQAPPKVEKHGTTVTGSPGRWDPGVRLSALWEVDGKLVGEAVVSDKEQSLSYTLPEGSSLKLLVTGTKRGYETETRQSETIS